MILKSILKKSFRFLNGLRLVLLKIYNYFWDSRTSIDNLLKITPKSSNPLRNLFIKIYYLYKKRNRKVPSRNLRNL